MDVNSIVTGILYDFSKEIIVSNNISQALNLMRNRKLNAFKSSSKVSNSSSPETLLLDILIAKSHVSPTTFLLPTALLSKFNSLIKSAVSINAPISFHLNSLLNLDNLNSIVDSGAVILTANSPQLATDFALLAQILSLKCSIPVIHAFDGDSKVSGTRVSKPVNEDVVREFRLDEAFSKGAKHGHQNEELLSKDLLRVFHHAKDSNAVSKHCELVQYVGSRHATDVLVTIGSIDHSVDSYIKNNNFGLIKVALYRPWLPELFLKSLPGTVERIVVSSGSVISNPLYSDIFSTIDNSQLSNFVSVKDVRLRFGTNGFTEETLDHMFETEVSASGSSGSSGSTGFLKAMGSRKLLKGLEVVSNVAYNWNDIVFVYPSLVAQESDEDFIHQLANNKTSNLDGNVPDVLTLSSQLGAGSVIHGAISKGAVVSSIMPSSTLKLMSSSLYQIASSGHSNVLNVTTGSLHSVHDVTDLYKAADAGFTIVASSSLQQIHDISIVLNLISRILKKPIIHAFDGIRVTQEINTVNVLSTKEIKYLVNTIHAMHDKNNGDYDLIDDLESSKNSIVDCFEKTLKFVSPYLSPEGKIYKPFEYVGHSTPDVVLVSILGFSSPLIESLVSQANIHFHNKLNRIGVCFVRLVRPWSMDQFVKAIPKSVLNIVILNHFNNLSTRDPLYLDVVSSLYNAQRRINVSTARFEDASVDGLTESGVGHLLYKMKHLSLSDHAVNEIIIPVHAEEKSKLQISLPIDGVCQGVFVHFDESVNQHKLVHDISQVLTFDHSTQINFSHHVSEDIETVNNTFTITNLKMNSAEAIVSNPSSHLITDANYIGIHNSSLVGSCFDSCANSATILLNTTSTSLQELVETDIVSIGAVEAWKRKKITLVLVDVDGIVNDHTVFLPTSCRRDYKAFVFAGLFLSLTKQPKQLIHQLKSINVGLEHEGGIAIGSTLLGALDSTLERLTLIKKFDDITIANEIDHQIVRDRFKPVTGYVAKLVSDVPTPSDEQDSVFFSGSSSFKFVWSFLFPETFKTVKACRPDVPEKTFQVKVSDFRRLTPTTYDRNVFHIEFDTTGTNLTYAIGEALAVYGHNDTNAVREFLSIYGVDANSVYKFSPSSNHVEFRTIEQIFVQILDLFGKPGKKFFQSLLEHTTDIDQLNHLGDLVSSPEAMQAYVDAEFPSYADVLIKFSSSRPPMERLLELIPAIKPRHYSIASSMNMHPNSVHLLVVLVDWETKSLGTKVGQCTRYLSSLKVGDLLTVSVRQSVMKLPECHSQPVIMAGLGTGMAPFRAFIQERAYQQSLGVKIGPMMLYFGSRHRTEEYLYGEELDVYLDSGIVTHLGLAFSRDQKEKVYIQHRMREDAVLLGDLMMKNEGVFYLCGPTWPVPDVRDAWVEAFRHKGMKIERGLELIEELKVKNRFILEVY